MMEFLGFTVDTVRMECGPDKKDPCGVMGHAERRASLRKSPCSASGEDECNFPSNPSGAAILSPPTEALAATLNQHSECSEAQVSQTSECREELMWWDTHMIIWNGKSLLKKVVDMIIDSDASLTGWGTTSQNQRTGGPWSQTESRMHMAATLAVKAFLKKQNQDVSTPQVGQYHSSGIHKQPGGNIVQGFGRPGEEPVDVVPGTEYPHHSPNQVFRT